jgi:hypothetical protein
MKGCEFALKVLKAGKSCTVVRAFTGAKLEWLFSVQPDDAPGLPDTVDFAAMQKVPAHVLASADGQISEQAEAMARKLLEAA